MTTRATISHWFERAKNAGAIKMIVVCDSFSYEDYPVNVMSNENTQQAVDRINGEPMQRVMEVYDTQLDLETQLNEPKAFHV